MPVASNPVGTPQYDAEGVKAWAKSGIASPLHISESGTFDSSLLLFKTPLQVEPTSHYLQVPVSRHKPSNRTESQRIADPRTATETTSHFSVEFFGRNEVHVSNSSVDGSWVPVAWVEGWMPTVSSSCLRDVRSTKRVSQFRCTSRD